MTTETVHNDTTDAPTCPPWLDLDAIVSPELRQRIADLTHSGRILGAEVRDWAIAAFEVAREYHKARTEVRDYDLGDLLSALSGYDKLFDVADDMSQDAGVLGGNTVCRLEIEGAA